MRRNDQSTSPIILRFLSTKCGIDLKRGSVKIHKMCHLRQGRGVPRDQPVSVGTAPLCRPPPGSIQHYLLSGRTARERRPYNRNLYPSKCNALTTLTNVSSMNIMSGSQCVSKSPSKLEGVPEGRGRVPSSLAVITHSSGALSLLQRYAPPPLGQRRNPPPLT